MVTRERLLQLFVYCPVTGVFTRRATVGRHDRWKAGTVAGSTDHKGYRVITIDGCSYRAHRLAWLYVHGTFPKDQIDHWNGVKSANDILNLREASNAENHQNERRPRKNNLAGRLGVVPAGVGFRAFIKANGKTKAIGRFMTRDEAHRAYVAAKAALHPFSTLGMGED